MGKNENDLVPSAVRQLCTAGFTIVLFGFVVFLCTLSWQPEDWKTNTTTSPQRIATYDQKPAFPVSTAAHQGKPVSRPILPTYFVENAGQTAANVRFILKGIDKTMFFAPSGVHVSMSRRLDSHRISTSSIRMVYVGAKQDVFIEGLQLQDSATNFIRALDDGAPVFNARSFGSIVYHDLYTDIDLVYTSDGNHIKSEFIVRPGGDPGHIRMRYEGTDQVTIRNGGVLVASTADGEIIEDVPVLYQPGADQTIVIEGAFQILGENEVGFHVGTYDPRLTLVIDPDLLFSTYYGGNEEDGIMHMAFGPDGSHYIVGTTGSTNLPITPGVVQITFHGGLGADEWGYGDRGYGDGFIARLNQTGETLLYATYLGGSESDVVHSIAVDNTGNAYIVGFTGSTDFPSTPGAYQTVYPGGTESAFAGKLDPTGAPSYLTFVGTDSNEGAFSLAIDEIGRVYFAGGTSSPAFPTAGTPVQPVFADDPVQPVGDAFFAILNETGDDLLYSTFLGGTQGDIACSLDRDPLGNIHIIGYTQSNDFIAVNSIPETGALGGTADMFVTKLSPIPGKLDPTEYTVDFSTVFGSERIEEPIGIVGDEFGNTYAAGFTDFGNFPTTPGAYQTVFSGLRDLFIVKIPPGGNVFAYSTLLGTPDMDEGGVHGFALGRDGTVWVTGLTMDPSFPTTDDAYQPAFAGGFYDAFLTQLSANGDEILYSTFIGGRGTDVAHVLAIGPREEVCIAGRTNSGDFPRKNPYQSINYDIDHQEFFYGDGFITCFEGTITDADLAITLVDNPDPVRVEDELTYTVTISNFGPLDATNIVATDMLPADVTFISASTNCLEDSGIVTCNLATLATGADLEFTIVVIPEPAAGKTTLDRTISNSVSVTADEPDPDPTNNTASSTTQVLETADLALLKTDSDDPVDTNTTFTYSLTVTNNGPSQATGVTLVDTLPVEVTFISTDNQTCIENNGVVTCSVGTLDSGQSATVEIQVTAPAIAGTITNSAGVSGNEIDTDDTNNVVTEDTDVVEAPALARIEISPSSVDLNVTQTQLFTAAGFDQFDEDFAISPVWTATGGNIDTNGLYTAGDASGSYTVTTTDSGIQGSAAVTILSGVAVEDESVPIAFALHQNYPNPFNARTIIPFDVKENTPVHLQVFNLLGHEVRLLTNRMYAPGRYQVSFEVGLLPSGLYVYRITMGVYENEKTMLLLK